jgi:hypothetical protein
MKRGGFSLPLRLLFLAAWFCACGRSSENSITPPATSPLSRPVIGYGVISLSYVTVADEPDPSGVSLGYLRMGSVVRILERRRVTARGNAESWVLVEGNYQGWLREDVMQIFENEAQAATAAGLLAQ